MSNTTPVRIQDKNGKTTTVHKRVDATSSSGARLLPSVAPRVPTEIFHNFSLLTSGDSASLKFTDDKSIFTISRRDDEKNVYLMIEGDGEPAYFWMKDGDDGLTFDDRHAQETFDGLDDATKKDLLSAVGDFYDRNHTSLAYMRIPVEIPADQARSSFDYIGDRLDSSDGLYARADYAEFSDEGVAYGVHVNYSTLGEVFAGAQLDGEDDEAFEKRQIQAAIDNWDGIADVIRDEYGAELADGNNTDQGDVEFYVEYEDGGAKGSSVEYMGDRVENETQLLDYLNDSSYGSDFVGKIARKFGYSVDSNGEWAKD